MTAERPFKNIDEIIQFIGGMFQTSDTQILIKKLEKTKQEGKPIK
jgi:hypothetical protein